MKIPLILATESPKREVLFSTLGLEFMCEASGVDEYTDGRPANPRTFAQYLAKLKAEAVSKKHNSGIVVGFHTVNYFEDQILQKPKSTQEKDEMFRRLARNSLDIITGVHLININTGANLKSVASTKVFFRPMDDNEIERYLEHNGKFDGEMGYNFSQGYGSTFVQKIEGSPTNFLYGLPAERVIPLLLEIGYKI